jgi:GR25 family glycosyltransferase involved in LPS biosynthesis
MTAMDIVVINLDRSPRKLAEFTAANRGTIVFERFPAVDGLTLSKDRLVAQGVMHPAVDYTPGAMGCAMSHIALWRRAVASGQALTICEDDAHFNKDFNRFAADAVAKLTGKFDLILWGWNFDSVLVFDLWGISSCAAMFDAGRMLTAIDSFKAVTFTPTLYALQRAYGLVCYTISPQGAATLLSRALPLRPMQVFFPGLNRTLPNTGLDVVLSDLYPKIVALVSFPPLVLTKHERGRSTTLLDRPAP